MFSVIIPLYNKARYIEATLASLQRQTMTSFEALIIDDGSTDESVILVRPFLEDTRFHLIHQKNAGVSAARNNGILLAQYDYIAFLDSDDLWHPQYLEFQLKAIRQFSDAAIFMTGYTRVDTHFTLTGTSLVTQTQFHVLDHYFKTAYKDPIFWTSATVVCRSVLDQLAPFSQEISCGEDLDLWFRIMMRYRGVTQSALLAYYRNSENANANDFNLPAIEKHLVYHLIDWYRPFRSLGNKELNAFMYDFVLNYIVHYYFMEAYHQEAAALVRHIPMKYKLRKARFFIYLLPYPVSRRLYALKMSGRN